MTVDQLVALRKVCETCIDNTRGLILAREHIGKLTRQRLLGNVLEAITSLEMIDTKLAELNTKLPPIAEESESVLAVHSIEYNIVVANREEAYRQIGQINLKLLSGKYALEDSQLHRRRAELIESVHKFTQELDRAI